MTDLMQWAAIFVLAGLVLFLLCMLGAVSLAVMAGRETPVPEWPRRRRP